jgi:hypothetical protein
MNWLKNRFSEPSTYVGVGLLGGFGEQLLTMLINGEYTSAGLGLLGAIMAILKSESNK